MRPVPQHICCTSKQVRPDDRAKGTILGPPEVRALVARCADAGLTLVGDVDDAGLARRLRVAADPGRDPREALVRLTLRRGA